MTSGTLIEKTKKPFKVWFRAIFEISSRRNGISAKDLQRIMGFGSYKTAWAWLHKLRTALARSQDSEPLGPFVEMDEALVGGKGGPNKELILVAAEAGNGGRIRLAHAANNDEATLKAFADREVAPDACVVTDGHAGYNAKSLGARRHEAKVQTKAERRSPSICRPPSTSSPSGITAARPGAWGASPRGRSRVSSHEPPEP